MTNTRGFMRSGSCEAGWDPEDFLAAQSKDMPATRRQANIWRASDPPLTADEARSAKVVEFLLGNKLKNPGFDVARTLSLYRFIQSHGHLNSSQLAARLLDERGAPLYTAADVDGLRRRMPRSGAQHGGGGGEILDQLASRLGDMASPFPPNWDKLFGLVFVLKTLEEIDLVGPFLSAALDSITLSLPVIAEVVGSGVSLLLAIAPIPYAGVAGDLLGYAVSALFIFTAVFLNVSRKQFGSAFKVVLELVPFLGEALSDAARNFEVLYARYEKNRERLLTSTGKFTPSGTAWLKCKAPLLTGSEPGCPAPLDMATVRAEVESTFLDRIPFLREMGITSLSDFGNPAALLEKVKGAATSAATSALGVNVTKLTSAEGLQQMAANKLGATVSAAGIPTNAAGLVAKAGIPAGLANIVSTAPTSIQAKLAAAKAAAGAANRPTFGPQMIRGHPGLPTKSLPSSGQLPIGTRVRKTRRRRNK
jgi:hypothetical protein